MKTQKTHEVRLSRLENLLDRQYIRTAVRLDDTQAKRVLNLSSSYRELSRNPEYTPPYKPAA